MKIGDVTLLYCCGCREKVRADRVSGQKIYPGRPDLFSKSFWRCRCGLHVGCHADGRPLGCIPTIELAKARGHIHALIDPAWKSGRIRRTELYRRMSAALGRRYHTAQLRTVEEAREAYRAAKRILEELPA